MKKILIIEDDPYIRQSFVEILGTTCEEYIFYEASNGDEGVELANKYIPDLILSDIMMPEIDGYQVFEKLKKKSKTAAIPFLFLTAKSNHNDMRKAMKLGVDDFISKPIDPYELIEIVKTRLNKQDIIKKRVNKKLKRLTKNISHTIPHELKTPLNSILGYSEILISDIDDLEKDEMIRMLSIINGSGKRLQRIVENLLYFVSIETAMSHKKRLKQFIAGNVYAAHIAIKQIVENAFYTSKRTNDYKLSLEKATINTISEQHFYKIIEEIVSNAIKFSDNNTFVEINSKVIDDKYFIEVKDQGVGISEKKLNTIDAFIQFDRKKYEQQGAGLGLFIAQKLTEIHNGTFQIESKVNIGTTIRLSFNLEASEK